jgi:hypothetical protein
MAWVNLSSMFPMTEYTDLGMRTTLPFMVSQD